MPRQGPTEVARRPGCGTAVASASLTAAIVQSALDCDGERSSTEASWQLNRKAGDARLFACARFAQCRGRSNPNNGEKLGEVETPLGSLERIGRDINQIGGDPYGNRTRASAVKGPRPNR